MYIYYILYYFNKARHAARTEGRWLLVNLQSHEQFSSQLLNRDTWTDETIESILRTTYLFWQRGHTTLDGKSYMRTYKINADDDLPHIAIIDPRTGAKLVTLTVRSYVLYSFHLLSCMFVDTSKIIISS